MYRILLVEDDIEFQILAKKTLESDQITVEIASKIEDALEHLGQVRFDMVLVDLNLDGEDGMDLVKLLRAAPPLADLPVIFLTSDNRIENKLGAFSLGAEDYISKSMDRLELKARIESRLKKLAQSKKSPDVLRMGPLELDLIGQKAIISGKELGLTPNEFKLLLMLSKNADQPVSRDHLLRSVWGEQIHVSNRTVDTHISGLRKKMGELSTLISSIPGTGYKFSLSRS